MSSSTTLSLEVVLGYTPLGQEVMKTAELSTMKLLDKPPIKKAEKSELSVGGLCDEKVKKLPQANATSSAIMEMQRYYIGAESKVYEVRYHLPPEVTCTQCVLQWRYLAANNWGRCDNASARIGCGPQEEFRACADIAIEDKAGSADDTPYKETNVIEEENDINLNNNEIDHVYSDQQEDWLFVSVIIILSGMFFTVVAYAFLFIYYYGANKTLNPCWQSTVYSVRQVLKTGTTESIKPVPPPRTKKPVLNSDVPIISTA
ncbi:hypothetical protein J6590_065229 [Homalodisca vitripennis]|nr:hypothetical protein J6590_065229 [Homalodisca vitripennis]